MTDVRRLGWLAAAVTAVAVGGVLVVGGLPASAEAWADRRVAGCGSSAAGHGPWTHPSASPAASSRRPVQDPSSGRRLRQGAAPAGRPVPGPGSTARPPDPADYRMGTFRAAGCQAWLRLHRRDRARLP